MIRLVLLSMFLTSCVSYTIRRKVTPKIQVFISPTTDYLLIGNNMANVRPYQGTRERYFDIVGIPDCMQFADRETMLVVLYDKFGEKAGYVLFLATPENYFWKRVATITTTKEPAQIIRTGDQITLLLSNGEAHYFKQVQKGKKHEFFWKEINPQVRVYFL